jgi:hypothetical protein
MGMDRRSFFKWFGVGVGAAPAVRSVVTMPDAPVVNRTGQIGLESIRFIDGHFDPYRRNLWDVQDGLLYDRIRFKAGQTIPHYIDLFCTPIGQACPYTGVTKTHRHTNMYQPGMLYAPNQFLAQRALFAVHSSALQADIDAMSGAAFWEFWLVHKVMWRGPMLLQGPGKGGLRDVVKQYATGPAHPIAIAQNPLPDEVMDAAHHARLTGGVFIPPQCPFRAVIQTPDLQVTLTPASEGGTGLDLLIAFQGADARAVA